MSSVDCQAVVGADNVELKFPGKTIAIPTKDDIDFTPLVEHLSALVEAREELTLQRPRDSDVDDAKIRVALGVIEKIVAAYNEAIATDDRETTTATLSTPEEDDPLPF